MEKMKFNSEGYSLEDIVRLIYVDKVSKVKDALKDIIGYLRKNSRLITELSIDGSSIVVIVKR